MSSDRIAKEDYVDAAVAGGSGAPYAELSPADYALLAWTVPWWLPATTPGGPAMASGDVWVVKMRNPTTQTVTNVVGNLGTAGGTFNSPGAKVAIFSEDGATRHFVTGDVASSLGGTGVKTLAFTGAGSLAAGVYWLAFWASVSAGNMPRWTGTSGNPTTPLNIAGKQAVSKVASSQSDMPSTITLSTAGGGTAPWILGLT